MPCQAKCSLGIKHAGTTVDDQCNHKNRITVKVGVLVNMDGHDFAVRETLCGDPTDGLLYFNKANFLRHSPALAFPAIQG